MNVKHGKIKNNDDKNYKNDNIEEIRNFYLNHKFDSDNIYDTHNQKYNNYSNNESEVSSHDSDKFYKVKDIYDQGYDHDWEDDNNDSDQNKMKYTDDIEKARNEGIINLYNILKENNAIDEESGNIKWGDKMWKEVEDDWENNDKKKMTKYRVRKKKKEVSNLPDQRTGSSVSGASILSSWSTGIKEVVENEPKLKFEDEPRYLLL